MLPHTAVPAAPTGADVEIVVNADAGRCSAQLARSLGDALPDAVVQGCLADDFERAVAAAAGRCRVLGVAGGDGSVSLAATYAWRYRLPLLVLPAGSDNRFAHGLGLESVDQALDALSAGTAALVDVSCAGDRVFLRTCAANASTLLAAPGPGRGGGLPGRLSALRRLLPRLRSAESQDIVLEGRPRRLWLWHAVNELPVNSRAQGQIGLRLIDAERPFGRLRTLLALLFGDPVGGRFYERSASRAWEITAARDEPLDLVLDDEIRLRTGHLVLHKVRCALAVYARA